MKTLAITFDNGLLSDFARENIRNAIKSTDADHIFYGPNPNEMMELYGIFLKKTGTFCPPCMRGIEIVSKMGADMFDIPLIFKGTGRKYSYLSFVPELFQSGDPDFFDNVIKGERLEHNTRAMSQFRVTWNMKRIVHLGTTVLRLPDPTTPRHVALFEYLDPSIEEMVDTIKQKMKWKEPEGQLEHMDCKASPIASYLQSRKLKGISDKTCKNSSLVRLGIMERDEALAYENEFADNVPEPENLNWFLNEIGIQRKDLDSYLGDWTVVEKYRNKNKRTLARMYGKLIGS
jgi:hypothetical protein